MSSSASETRGSSLTARTGWLGLLCLVVAGLSGLLLAWRYRPDTALAHASLVDLQSATPSGALVRAVHANATHLALALLLVHLLWSILRPGASGWRPVRWGSGLAGLGLVLLLAYSGRVLPWDTHGGISLVVARTFLQPGGISLLDAVLGPSSLVLERLWVLHLLLSGLLVAAVASHVPLRERLGAWAGASAGRQRRVVLTAGAALTLLLLLSLLLQPGLGAPFHAGAAATARAEWYFRWLQYLALINPTLARLALALLLALALATPLLVRRLGARPLRAAWLGTLAAVVLLSVLPVS